MHRILLLNHVNTYFTGLFPLALMLKNSDEFEPVVLFSRQYPTVFEDIEICKQHQLEVCFIGELEHLNLANTSQKSGKFSFTSRSILNSIRIRLAYSSLGLIFELDKIAKQIRFIRQLFNKKNIELLILPADNRYDFSLYVRAARQVGVASIVVPQFMAGPLEWAEFVKNHKIYRVQSLINRLAAALFPRWSLNYQGNRLLALPGPQILAHELFKVSPPLPWVLHSGSADVIAIESEAIQDYCLNEGLPLEQLQITGSITHDQMFQVQSNIAQKKSLLCKTLDLDEQLPIILSALPCDMIYTDRSECDFKIYEELVCFWCETIASIDGYQHVIVLHPSVRFEEMKYLEKFGAKISREPTSSLIPLCDIYVSSVSSTIQWAIACGKPVLNYDVYRYRYTDYQKVPGVITLEEKKDFIQVLKKLAFDACYREEISNAQLATAKKWGCLDGQAGKRLQDLFAKTIKNFKEKV
jgi:hypothetical protein